MIDLQSSYISACVLEAALIRVANADSYVVQNCNDASLRSIPPASVHPVHGVHSAFLNLGRQIRVYQLAAPKLGEGGCPSVVKTYFRKPIQGFPKPIKAIQGYPSLLKGFLKELFFFFPPPKSVRASQSPPSRSKVLQTFPRPLGGGSPTFGFTPHSNLLPPITAQSPEKKIVYFHYESVAAPHGGHPAPAIAQCPVQPLTPIYGYLRPPSPHPLFPPWQLDVSSGFPPQKRGRPTGPFRFHYRNVLLQCHKPYFNNPMKQLSLIALCLLSLCFNTHCAPKFHVVAFYTGRNDLAHISFVHEANQWFPKMAKKYNFTYDATTNWADLNTNFLSNYQVVLFLDTRPDD